MGKQVSIRSDMAHELAVKLSERHHKTITALIEEALAEKDARDEAVIEERMARWRVALEHDWALLRESKSDFKLEDMYDDDGLPI